MKGIHRILAVAALLALAPAVRGEVLTANSLLVAYRAGATVDGIVEMVNNPASSIATTPEDLQALRAAGLPEAVLTAIAARIAAPTPPPAPLQPDDPRLVDLVRLIKSGTSESIVVEQVHQSGRAFNLSVADLLYLKQNGVQESTIASLMATQQAVPPPAAGETAGSGSGDTAAGEVTFNDLVFVRRRLVKQSHPGRLILRGETLSWIDGNHPEDNFELHVNGLRKVWFTCQARTSENFCYQINFDIVKGPRYRFRDINQESGSNAAVQKVMDTLRKRFPTLPYGTPD